MKDAKARRFTYGGNSMGWFNIEIDPLRSGRLRIVNYTKFINDGQRQLRFKWKSNDTWKMWW